MKTFKYLLLRRVSQLAILAIFLLGPLAGVWIVKGNLNFSYTLDLLPVTDPYVIAQSLFAGHVPAQKALIGVALALAFYLIVGGRAYCAWVCPMNLVTDAAGWLRARLGIRSSVHITRSARYWILAMTLVLAAATGTIAWELVNPVSMLHRGLIFGIGAAWSVVLAVFLFDTFVARRGWCGHLCPVGAFYGLIGRFALVRVAAVRRVQCDDCMDCYAACPEPQVITPALKGEPKGASPVILSGACTNCGRCIDVCSKNVFELGTRLRGAPPGSIKLAEAKEVP